MNFSEKARQYLTKIMAKYGKEEKYTKLYETLRKIETEKEKANDNFKKGDYDGAIHLYTNLLEMDTNNKNFSATILANRALAFHKKGKQIEALNDINKSISMNESYVKAYCRRAQIYVSLRNPEKAKADLNKAIKLDPGNLVNNSRF